ncbi:hypothetical protein CCACVL1_04823 [Corchorus capsularis]|uniref:Uncharacterized protein n=1 Tax=Corchorus capsularis TaxID=210143 RepID=A0A1R3JPH2_COCAP|nr:hypothetical protein CCACVL1_04823 [Corchorus capsularis]
MEYLRLLGEKLQNLIGNGGDQKGYEELMKNFDPNVPETIDMLSSLPAEEVWKIRKASKGLCDLIQSPEFASKKHLERAPSIAFLQSRIEPDILSFEFGSMKFFYLDDDNKKAKTNADDSTCNLNIMIVSLVLVLLGGGRNQRHRW